MDEPRSCICIDLKSYYASVECVARGLDPLKARLLVADETRSDQTICLAVSPALKAIGVPARPRLFKAKQAVRLYDAGLFCCSQLAFQYDIFHIRRRAHPHPVFAVPDRQRRMLRGGALVVGADAPLVEVQRHVPQGRIGVDDAADP